MKRFLKINLIFLIVTLILTAILAIPKPSEQKITQREIDLYKDNARKVFPEYSEEYIEKITQIYIKEAEGLLKDTSTYFERYIDNLKVTGIVFIVIFVVILLKFLHYSELFGR